LLLKFVKFYIAVLRTYNFISCFFTTKLFGAMHLWLWFLFFTTNIVVLRTFVKLFIYIVAKTFGALHL